MSTTGLDIFDKAVNTTHLWLAELVREQQGDRQLAWHELSSVLRALRDHLPVDISTHLGEQLPLIIRGTYYEHYEPSKQPDRTRSLVAFTERVENELANNPKVDVDGVDTTRSVLGLLSQRLDPGLTTKLRDSLAEDLRDLWPLPSHGAH